MEEFKKTCEEVNELESEILSATESEGDSVSDSKKEWDIDSQMPEVKRSKTRKSKGNTRKKQGDILENPDNSSDESESGKNAQGNSSKATVSKGKKVGKAPSYTVEECGKKARQLGTSREVVLIALREAGKKEGDLVSYAEAKVIIRTFLKREVL